MIGVTQAQRRLREARSALRNAICSCDGAHDRYWAKCPRMLAECAVDDALWILRDAIARTANKDGAK